MNWKLVVLGGLAYFVATMIIGMVVTGPLIHEGLLEPAYMATESFWRPELRSDPPDVGALMPIWMTFGVVTALVIAALYGWLRPAFGEGPGWMSGVKYGLVLSIFAALFMMGWSGLFNLPSQIWVWWAIDGLILNLAGGAALGWVAQRF